MDDALTADPGGGLGERAGDEGDDGTAIPGDRAARVSPLTYGKVFGAIPRMSKSINTPVINQRVSDVFGLPSLSSSTEFKKIYAEGREVLR